MHRIIVIGRGLVGSAAGRHLSELTDGVVVLGPDEPADRAAHTGVFASPFLAVPDGAEGLFEGGRAGYISPRALVRAQTEVARQQGAVIIADQVTSLRPTAGGVEVDTGRGGTLRAERVLVATGAFTDACGLLSVDLKLRVLGRTVVLAHIDDRLLTELVGMPALIDAESGAYILPPIRYPDGRHYLKIGIGSTADLELRSVPDLIGWFKSAGSADNRRDLRRSSPG